MSPRVVAAAALALLAGCTRVVVTRVDTGNEEGLRYYLPQSFLVVTPQEDGTIETHVEYVADRSQAYAVTATSYLATHNLVVKLNQGLLTEVSLTKDTSAVAAEVAKAAGEIQKTRIETQTAATKAASDKADTETKARKDARQKIVDSLALAQVDLAQATAKKNALPAGSDEQKEAAVAEAAAQAKVTELTRQLGAFDAGGTGAFSTLEDATKTKPAPFRHVKRPGPVLLRIEEDANTPGVLQLVPVSFDGPDGPPQRTFDAYRGPKPPAEKPKPSSPTSIEFETKPPVTVASGGITTLKTKAALSTMDVGGMKGSGGNVGISIWPTVKPKSPTEFEVTFKKQTPPDTYSVSFFGRVSEDALNIKGSLQMIVTAP